MSNLQIGLAVAGGIVLAAVVAHGAWTSRRNIPRQPDPEPAREAEADDGDKEPVFDEADFAANGLGIPAPERKPLLDVLIDVIAPIALDNPVSGEATLAALPPTRRAGSKPFAIEGLNEKTQQWELPHAGQRYTAFQAGVQLANRSGALNEIEYSEFVMKVQAFADAINGAPDFPEMLEEVARARELDQFASAHDAQLGFMLLARQTAWSPGYIQQNAAHLGFVNGALPGRMVLHASKPGMPMVLGLAFDAQAALAEDMSQSAVHELSLSLDVAQVERSERAFARMCEIATSLAQTMDGVITDDNHRPLQPEAMAAIGTELEKLYDTLDARDLSAGSVLARRLFS